mgnify:CR=1 FL=1
MSPVAEAVRKVAKKLRDDLRGGRRSYQIDAEEVAEILLDIADEIAEEEVGRTSLKTVESIRRKARKSR